MMEPTGQGPLQGGGVTTDMVGMMKSPTLLLLSMGVLIMEMICFDSLYLLPIVLAII